MIKKYIEFAIKNGLVLHGINGFTNKVINTGETLRLITGKQFIEALSKGIWDNGKTSFNPERIGYKKILGYWVKNDDDFIDFITAEQAIAIRNHKLEEFITNILPDGNT